MLNKCLSFKHLTFVFNNHLRYYWGKTVASLKNSSYLIKRPLIMGMFSILADNILQLFRKYKAVNKGEFGHSIVSYCTLIYAKIRKKASSPNEGKTFRFVCIFSLE